MNMEVPPVKGCIGTDLVSVLNSMRLVKCASSWAAVTAMASGVGTSRSLSVFSFSRPAIWIEEDMVPEYREVGHSGDYGSRGLL